MTGALAALAAFAAAAAPAPPYPAEPVLVAFNEACGEGFEDFGTMAKHIRAAGWKSHLPKAGSSFARALAAEPSPPAYSFRRIVGGRSLFLTLSGSGGTATECRIADFDGREPIALAPLVRWSGRHPTADIGDYGQPTWGRAWEPGLAEGHGRTEIYYRRPAGARPGGVILATRAAQAAPAPPTWERTMLDAFKAACARTGNDIEPMKADALSAGWRAMADDGDPRIGSLIKKGREATEKDGTSTGATFRRAISGQDIFLIVSRYQDKTGYWGSGCRLYHFEASKPLDGALLETWMGKPPTGVQVPAPGLEKRLWEPSGWREGISVEVNHVPKDHPVGKIWGLSGNILVAQAIGGF
jgi:hypothetical protein